MDSTANPKASSRTSFARASITLFAGLAACGGLGKRPVEVDAALPPVWPAEVTVATCERYASVAVGDYVMQSNYWNLETCPGTQCVEFNTATGAFSVTQGPPACGDNVASYPNVLYGCSFGSCTPNTMLPMQVSALSTVTSSWDFSAGGTSKDQYNVAYDIWFCPDNNCGSTGFPNGLELMIWLDYKNVHGWKTSLGSKTLAGHSWDVWLADMLVGQASDSWTYLTYMIKGPQVTSLTDFDLGAFIRDAVARGYIKDTWYMYAIQAGMEVRTGGMPYTSNSFSVTINGVTPSTVPTPYDGPSCDGGAPTAEGTLAIVDNYVTAGPLHGYGAAWTWVGADSSAIACAAPTCTASAGGAVSCSPPLGPTALCTSGTVTADPTYNSVAGLGFNLNQDVTIDAGVVDSGVDAGAVSLGAVTIPNSIMVAISRSATLGGNSTLRLQLTDVDGNLFCYGGPLNVPIAIDKFNTKCWNNTGVYATPSTLFTKLDVIVPSAYSVDLPFSYCITSVSMD